MAAEEATGNSKTFAVRATADTEQIMSDIGSRLKASRAWTSPSRLGWRYWRCCTPATPARCLAQSSFEETFASPEQAGGALVQAVQAGDERAVMRILGAEKQLVSSGDEVQDRLDRERFVQKYEQMHRLVREEDGTLRLYVGAENWPFPIPLVSNHGAWYFDVEAGMQEVMFRRIGENEFGAMRVCHALALARSAGEPSAPDRNDPIALLLVNVGGGGAPGAFRGYYFRRLESGTRNAPARVAGQATETNATAGFAFVAYPAEYRRSGVMTFVVDQTGVVYEKDLGPDTAAIARTMTWHTQDPTWHPVQQVSPAS